MFTSIINLFTSATIKESKLADDTYTVKSIVANDSIVVDTQSALDWYEDQLYDWDCPIEYSNRMFWYEHNIPKMIINDLVNTL